MNAKRIKIMGCEFDSLDTQQTVKYIENLIRQDKREYLCTVNVSILMMMRSDPRLTEIINNSAMVVADGQPIIWVSKYINKPLPERVTGVDLVSHLAAIADKNSWGIYLLGATQAVVQGVKETLSSDYPNLVISGYDDGYFGPTNADERVTKIRNSGAKILLIAMGVPRQEYFIDDYWEDFGVNFAIGVGGSFDVIAGVSRRAPLWMQKTGLEWLFRISQEPRRLLGRYIKTNTLFIYLFFKEIILGIPTQTSNKQ